MKIVEKIVLCISGIGFIWQYLPRLHMRLLFLNLKISQKSKM